MINTTEVKLKLEETFQPYILSLDNYTDADFDFKKEPEIWSLGQMYEHVYVAGLYFFLANIKRCLEQRKGAFGKEDNDSSKYVLMNNELPNKKFKVPASENAPEPVSRGIAFYQAHLPQLLNEFIKIEPLVAQDGGEYRTEHPLFSFLNAKEWYQHMEIHLRHHLRQKAELESFLVS